MNYPKSISEILKITKFPVISADSHGNITDINNEFSKAYGWSKDDLVGESLTSIMPDYMHDSHNLGFSRFMITHEPRVAGKPLSLPILCKNGKVLDAEHYILADQKDSVWRFAAIIRKV